MTDGSDQPLEDYYSALRRLQNREPKNVPKWTRISNDAVSLEAGRGKGSIKKSRAVFADLIQAINEAALAEQDLDQDQKGKLEKYKGDAKDYRLRYEAALARELSLLKELYEVKKQLASLTGEKVVPLRKPPSNKQD
ncbi:MULTISPECIES: hypothetical protein [Paraburkholderia]|uniref:hypothetical protein n=1 Tax=Paraburkholderia TaxID=1822464 RepID=UPI002259568F|nr:MULTISPECIES: hypothetical protein [Paraburkholderia]MCX4177505.1 hypothetical protein [Paraburkholderia madseniana]MDQ6465494.1 hypothetical protein [Paraburkholderia madseniana]